MNGSQGSVGTWSAFVGCNVIRRQNHQIYERFRVPGDTGTAVARYWASVRDAGPVPCHRCATRVLCMARDACFTRLRVCLGGDPRVIRAYGSVAARRWRHPRPLYLPALCLPPVYLPTHSALPPLPAGLLCLAQLTNIMPYWANVHHPPATAANLLKWR